MHLVASSVYSVTNEGKIFGIVFFFFLLYISSFVDGVENMNPVRMSEVTG